MTLGNTPTDQALDEVAAYLAEKRKAKDEPPTLKWAEMSRTERVWIIRRLRAQGLRFKSIADKIEGATHHGLRAFMKRVRADEAAETARIEQQRRRANEARQAIEIRLSKIASLKEAAKGLRSCRSLDDVRRERYDAMAMSMELLARLAEHHAKPPPDVRESARDVTPYNWRAALYRNGTLRSGMSSPAYITAMAACAGVSLR